MSLSSVGNPAWETIRGVRFSMLHGSTLVAVLVTHAALHDIERAPPGVGRYLACFNKHRDAIEEVANVKHQRAVRRKRCGDRTARRSKVLESLSSLRDHQPRLATLANSRSCRA